ALCAHRPGPGQLMDANSGGHIGEVVLVSWSDNAIVPTAARRISSPGIVRKTMQRHRADTLGELGIAGYSHAPFAGGNRFVRVKRKATYRRATLPTALPGAAWPWPPCCGEGVCCILHDPEPMAVGEVLHIGHIQHAAADVDRDNPDHGSILGNG